MSTYKKRRKQREIHIPEETQLFFDELCDILTRTGTEIRIEKGYFKGGLCLLEDRRLFILNKDLSMEQNIELLLEYLQNENLDNLYISPRIREKLDSIHKKIEAKV